MPLSRYEIRNEYSLADPELYKSADRDDPEALLEGVAMAGLVGVLRQLGDLAEFAAEVFHNLHEEVMATAERGHSLKARVQQLEMEFPLIEKAFLSQTNHSDFFYTAGVDWHPNMHIDQNYITRGDLPRFIMDSYEEARGPPQLFLLDKFDVAGAGACLKRFTDPSFFKVEPAALGITDADVQRDKVRKGKRRGSRWRNGETPEVLPTPHAKLHELLLEDRIEKSPSNPARLVKLKRRLNGFPFDLKTGKSYIEKIFRTPPDYRELHEVRNSSPLKLLDNDFRPELETDYFGSESLDAELTNRSPSMSPDLKNGLQNGSMREFETSDESNHFRPEFERDEIGLKSSDLQLTHRSPSLTPDMRDSVPNISMNDHEVGNIKSNLYEDVVEKQIMVDKENKSESSVYQSDDVASEVENYVDALAAMESELETDSELRSKGNLHVLSNTKLKPGLDAAMTLHQAHYSDSQSMGSSILSDDGNSSSKKYSNSSYSGSPRIVAKKALLEDEVSDEIDSSNETGEAKRISRPLKWRGRTRSAGGNKVAAIPPYKTNHVEQSISISDVSPGFMVNKDAHASVGENGVMNMSSDSTSSSRPEKTEYNYSLQVAENYSLSNGNDSHLTESSSSKPITSDDTCFSGEFKDQHMEESVDKNMHLLPDVAAVSCSLEDLCSSDKYQTFIESANDNPRMPEHLTKPLPLEQSENGLLEGLPNDESGMSFSSVESMPQSGDGERDFDAYSVNQIDSQITTMSSAEEQTKEPSLQSMPQAGDGEHEFEAYPVDKQIDSQMTTMSSAEEQTMDPRSPELETANREIDAGSTEDSLVIKVTDTLAETSHISGVTDTLQPLDSVNRSINNQIEEQFPDTPLSEMEYCSDGADLNVIIPGGSTMALPGGEIALDMEYQAQSGNPKGGNTKDIQPPVVLDGIPLPDVETSDNRDEILHELPSLAVTNVASAEETGEKHSSVADDMLLLNAAKVETSSYQMENLHELSNSVGEEQGRVASSTDLGERGTTHCELIAGSVNLSDADVEGGRIESNSCGVDAEVPDQHSGLELFPQEKPSDDVGQYNKPSGSISLAFGLLPETVNGDPVELPPLPPLPPVQWRMGKKQASLAHESTLLPNNNILFPSMTPSLADPNAQAPKLIMPSRANTVESSLPVCESISDTPDLDHPSSLQVPLESISGSNSNLLSLSELQSLDNNLPLPETSPDLAAANNSKFPAKLDEMPRLDDRASTSSNASSSGTHGNEAAACDVELTEMDSERPHNMMLSLEGEVAWPAHDEGKPHGVRPMKPPRQRNPLIDAVIALDRSKFRKVTEQPRTYIEKADERDSLLENLQLRKVTEQPRTPILNTDERDSVLENLQLRKVTEQPNTQIQKTVERDSLLEQIRARTVNLKPTVVSRPAVQGPTNLKVAAILEKAKTIRQAFAGSDDDDDDDSWSDS